MKKIFGFLFLHYFAGKAMAAIISNQKMYDTIVKLSLDKKDSAERENEITDAVVHLAYRYARKMANKVI